MVAELVRQRVVAVGSPVHDAFRAVLRHRFLPEADVDDVYRDAAVVTHRSPDGVPISSSSQPSVMAQMLEQLAVRPGHRVLEVGTGTGYNAALLATLVGPQGSITTVDVDPAICVAARRRLLDSGATNVSVVAGDGWMGVGGRGLFDRIEATVGVSDLSTAWITRLEGNGVLVAPLWLRAGLQASVAFRRTKGGLESTSVEPCAFMRLRGAGAGDPAYERVGEWTVGFDKPDPEKAALVGQLLQEPPEVEPAPALDPGWFTGIALRRPDAISFFSTRREGALVCCGILDPSVSGIAMIASSPGVGSTMQVFGGELARRRLLGLIETEEPIDVRSLTIRAIPAGVTVDGRGALAVLRRRNFSFVIDRRTPVRVV